ncbi:putative bifunctional diguanylate cyclase/phosphodiesterase [Oharaeibacter diazotrophicus]|uniref:PAS domain S-box-containing protein/diguanylate cyclase (GGDEF)-like protein n=1 Tax=Oharaeibacter diazotrophicus TaxID=1920512 RepID=A0A4R6R7W4_9HYPH|nr:GGDEF domain-containing phosphodiesterase [Oharaeibacter diazotrophicus]TDP81982.1 PAS domain S-box-containing protein/diguanylate cyclase (GGDEF)-like protein [Oharaeibacter diazotrophicus]BBE73614.1 cyclic di-GMP phosphodiesterase Gmr [Pleomorphomonas sp. SM30]
MLQRDGGGGALAADGETADAPIGDGELRLRLAVEATGLGIWDVDIGTGRRRWSDELKAMLGLSADAEASEELLLACVHPEDRDAVRGHNRVTFLSVDAIGEATFRIVRRDDGAVRWIHSRGRAVVDDAGRFVRRVGTFHDVTEQRRTHEALDLSLRRHRALIDATAEIVWHADATQSTGDGAGWNVFTGMDGLQATPFGWLAAVHPDDREAVLCTVRAAIAAGTAYTNEYRLRHAASDGYHWVVDRGVPLKDGAGRVVEWVGIISDVHGRRSAEEAIRLAAETDPLTGLANRAVFQAALDRVAARRDGGCVTVLLVDLDGFKEVNDGFGHDAGDRVLQAAAARIRAVVPPGATVARLGGDEFGILVEGIESDAAAALGAALIEAIGVCVPRTDVPVPCTATVGYSIHPCFDDDPGRLLKNADIALYAAKACGRGRVRGFDPAMRTAIERRASVLRNARDALARDAVVPYYQPKISLAGGAVIGFEALLRWHDGERTRSPADISDAFEDPELACRIGERMLAAAIADMRAWQDAELPFGHVAVNVATAEVRRPDFAASVAAALAAAGLSRDRLEIEITESVLLEREGGVALDVLAALEAAGIALSLDDFGTGYASLTHLKKFPMSWLKIDRSFVAGLETDGDSRAIVQAVLGMARNIGIRVVAEGVETGWQCRFLRENGCDAGQGYLFARPMPAADVPGFLAGFTQRRAAQLLGLPELGRVRAGRVFIPSP